MLRPSSGRGAWSALGASRRCRRERREALFVAWDWWDDDSGAGVEGGVERRSQTGRQIIRISGRRHVRWLIDRLELGSLGLCRLGRGWPSPKCRIVLDGHAERPNCRGAGGDEGDVQLITQTGIQLDAEHEVRLRTLRQQAPSPRLRRPRTAAACASRSR